MSFQFLELQPLNIYNLIQTKNNKQIIDTIFLMFSFQSFLSYYQIQIDNYFNFSILFFKAKNNFAKLAGYKNNFDHFIFMAKPMIHQRIRAITQHNPEVISHNRKKIDPANLWPLASPPKHQNITTPQNKKINIEFVQYNLNTKYHFSIRQTDLEHQQQEIDTIQENDCYLQITKKLQIALKRVIEAKKEKSLQQLDQVSNQPNSMKKVIAFIDPKVDKMLSRFQLLEKKRKEKIKKKRQVIQAERLNKNLNRTMPVESFFETTEESIQDSNKTLDPTLKISTDSQKQLKYTQYTYRPMISETAKIGMKKQEVHASLKQWKIKHNRSATEASQLSDDFTFKPSINDRSRKMLPRNRIPIYQRDKKPIYVQSTKTNQNKQQKYFKTKAKE